MWFQSGLDLNTMLLFYEILHDMLGALMFCHPTQAFWLLDSFHFLGNLNRYQESPRPTCCCDNDDALR